ncbi:PilX N-terminal domain-containing pilus assembly protein [Marinobacterium ramblicola]|uniref:PilX N-terminal domain-containing pilus assembly protein n=1 Tax=Marinobacterium ramblicola TaxID=2849041 RepID=UPI001C2D9717
MTLIVAVVLLALLTITVLTVTRLTTLELKTAANTNRAKEAFHIAQGGLDYGAMKYVEDGAAFTPSGTTSVAIPSGSGTDANISVVVSGGFATITAVGESPDTTGSATIAEKYGIVPLIDTGELPPLMAGGNFPPGGSFSIVTNPNGGGDGVPVSAWVKTSQTQGAASWQTCNLDEYLYEGNNATRTKDATTEWICDACTCQQADNHLCEAESGVDPADNCSDIIADACVPDAFENLFGVNIYEDSAACGGDSGVDPTIWQVYRTMGMQYGIECADLDADVGDIFYSGGAYEGELPLIWIEGDCDVSGTVASVDAPIILIVHGDVTMNSNGVMFGILFAFTDIYTGTDSDDYEIKINGSPKFYGSILVNGDVDLPNGSFTLVYAQSLLEKFSNSGGEFNSLARFPGSWTDLN